MILIFPFFAVIAVYIYGIFNVIAKVLGLCDLKGTWYRQDF